MNLNNFQSESCIADKEAVKKLIAVMKKGGTISWLDALEEITGERNVTRKFSFTYQSFRQIGRNATARVLRTTN
jgi:hypothetical protein